MLRSRTNMSKTTRRRNGSIVGPSQSLRGGDKLKHLNDSLPNLTNVSLVPDFDKIKKQARQRGEGSQDSKSRATPLHISYPQNTIKSKRNRNNS
jgi:hypothetical protein